MTRTATARRPVLAAWAGLNAVSAWGGAVALVVGATDFGARLDARLPFESLELAGAALALVVAVPLTVLAGCAWSGDPRTAQAAVASGALLVLWIVVQLAVLRSFSWLQPFYAGVGLGLVVVGARSVRA